MEYTNTGVTEVAVGLPTEEEREFLIKEGYTFMLREQYADYPHEEFEIWMK